MVMKTIWVYHLFGADDELLFGGYTSLGGVDLEMTFLGNAKRRLGCWSNVRKIIVERKEVQPVLDWHIEAASFVKAGKYNRYGR